MASYVTDRIVFDVKAEKGGFKTVVMEIKGNRVYSKLKYESGVHRVQRVPQTEAQGRVHTSTATVAIMPEVYGSFRYGLGKGVHPIFVSCMCDGI